MSPTIAASNPQNHLELRLQDGLDALLSPRMGPCVSMYLPSRPVGAGDEPARLRLKNLLARAEARLKELGEDALDLLDPLFSLTSNMEIDFWRHQKEALALFLAPGFFHTVKVPFPVGERLEVGDHFVIRPLLPLLGARTFHVLALSQNEVRLLEVRGRTVRRMDLEGVPQSLEEALGAQLTTQILQYHAASPSGPGARPAIYHGSGTGEEDAKAELLRYCRRVDSALAEILPDRSAPLVLAGVGYLLAIFREASSHPHLIEKGVTGNPEHLSDAELAQRALAVAEPFLAEARRHAAARYDDLAGSGRTSHHATDILPAARAGRVDVLFVSTEANLRGRCAEDGVIRPGNEDLLDLAAAWTLGCGGTVHVSSRDEVPEGGDLAAIFRY